MSIPAENFQYVRDRERWKARYASLFGRELQAEGGAFRLASANEYGTPLFHRVVNGKAGPMLYIVDAGAAWLKQQVKRPVLKRGSL